MFYVKNLKWTRKFVQNNIKIIEENHKLFPHRNRWNCDCHVIHDDDFDVTQINFSFLRNEYEKVVNELINELNKIQNTELSHISDIWYNYYKRGQYQEPHIHGTADIYAYTAVHYLIYDKKYHSKTEFTDKNIICPQVTQGDILFFPSNLEHYVLENTSNVPRLTVAFTVVFK
jgi:hypothetical protein